MADEIYRNCVARYEDLSGASRCAHPRSGYTKKPVTPEICATCRFAIGDSEVMPLPSIATRIKSAGKAVLDVVSDSRDAPEEEIARRQAICDACKYKDGRVCRACGCNLPAKQRMLGWKCDLGFWDVTLSDTPGASPPPDTNGVQ